jgi:hypothetical protein
MTRLDARPHCLLYSGIAIFSLALFTHCKEELSKSRQWEKFSSRKELQTLADTEVKYAKVMHSGI